MDNLEPITRNEMFLNGDDLEPITREEMILAGADLEPITRHEWFLKRYRGGGGGGGYDLVDIPNLPADIASFNDGTDLPMASLKVAVTPYQDLSHGDPSPSNICPIIGWDEVNVTRCGKNLFDKTATDTSKGFISGKWINQTGNTFSYSDWSVSEYIRVDGEKIAVSGMTVAEQVSSGRGGYCCYDKYKNVLGGGTYNALTQIITLPTNTEYIRISVWNANKDVCQLELSETATAYSPYNGATYTIDLNGTRYGGTLDATNGTMTVDRGYVDMGTLNWIYESDATRFRAPLTDVNTDSRKLISSIYHYSQNPIGAHNQDLCMCPYAYGSVPSIFCTNFSYTDSPTFKTAMNGVQLVYELATPITVQLSPTQVKSLEGVNNIFADCGQITEVKYFKKA